MGTWKRLATAIQNPSRISKYLKYQWGRLPDDLEGFLNKNVRKRVPFCYEEVVSGCGKGGVSLPRFSSRLFREVKLFQQAMGDYKAEKSLEIGCGYGRLTPWIMEYSREHHAIEPEKRLFEDAKRLNPKAYFHNVTAQKLPFPDSFFDLCVTWTVLQHIPPKELTKAIDEIKRVAKKTAILVVAEETGTYEGGTIWMRSMENWAELFRPWQLVWQTDRTLEEAFPNPCGKVMRFEQR